jgi:hypothetical protein|tara:strand:+ start:674 stop:1216 length:543 start_codon:yes stop_codon:yes gene_type:complete
MKQKPLPQKPLPIRQNRSEGIEYEAKHYKTNHDRPQNQRERRDASHLIDTIGWIAHNNLPSWSPYKKTKGNELGLFIDKEGYRIEGRLTNIPSGRLVLTDKLFDRYMNAIASAVKEETEPTIGSIAQNAITVALRSRIFQKNVENIVQQAGDHLWGEYQLETNFELNPRYPVDTAKVTST